MAPKTLKLGPKAMSVLFKPGRLEIYESLQIGGPASVADLALRLGRPADALYYHVKKLLSIGVIEEQPAVQGKRAGPGRTGAIYAAAARRLDVTLNPGSPRSREAWAEGGAAVLRLAQRDYARALESSDLQPDGPRRDLMIRRVKLRLDRTQLREVNKRLDALTEVLYQHAENTTGDLHAITFVMTPLEERSQR